MPRGKIPHPTIKRLSLYLRELESRLEAGNATISSRQLGNALGVTDGQVRKDFAYFGQFGHPGVGYRIAELISELRHILGTDRTWRAVVVGAGNLGRAVTRYGRLRPKGFEVVAVLDSDPTVVGSAIDGRRVRAVADLSAVVREHDVTIGMVAVPVEAAQSVAEAMVEAGIRGILNFAPRRLDVGDRVPIVSGDLMISLEQLAFKIALGRT